MFPQPSPRLEEPPEGADAEREGDEGGNFFITFQGEAAASKSDSVIDGSRRRVLNIAGRGHSKAVEKLRYVKCLKTSSSRSVLQVTLSAIKVDTSSTTPERERKVQFHRSYLNRQKSRNARSSPESKASDLLYPFLLLHFSASNKLL